MTARAATKTNIPHRSVSRTGSVLEHKVFAPFNLHVVADVEQLKMYILKCTVKYTCAHVRVRPYVNTFAGLKTCAALCFRTFFGFFTVYELDHCRSFSGDLGQLLWLDNPDRFPH